MQLSSLLVQPQFIEKCGFLVNVIVVQGNFGANIHKAHFFALCCIGASARASASGAFPPECKQPTHGIGWRARGRNKGGGVGGGREKEGKIGRDGRWGAAGAGLRVLGTQQSRKMAAVPRG